MKLYVFPIAPNPTKVRLYLAEKRAAGAVMAVEEVTVDLRSGEQRSAEHLARNPFGKLPVLETEDGGVLLESLAIIEYLEERVPDPPMLGASAWERARAREIERIADLGVLVPIARIVHTTRSPLGLPPEPVVADHFRQGLSAPLEHLDGLLADGREFLAGDRPTVADCTLAAGLQFGRLAELEPLDSFARIQAWSERYRARGEIEGILLV